MADNYLEKRMEELRSGKLAVKGGIPGIKPGSKRVVVVGGTSGEARERVLEYRKEGCRVAVFDSDEKAGRRMAYENGVRFHHVSLDDMKAIGREIEKLLKAWRDIDMIAGEANYCSVIGKIVKEWRNSLPIPDNSEVKIVIL